jgi:hypothetical protein
MPIASAVGIFLDTKKRRGFDMKVLLTILALAFAASAYTPAMASDHATRCVSGRYHEPLCQVKRWHRGRTVVIVEREPDVFMLPYAPYVVVNVPHE